MSDTTAERAPRRVRRWDRILGAVGRVLVASGLLLLAFVGYQLWGTGIEQAQRQNDLASAFDDLLATTTTTTVPVATTTTLAPTAASSTSPPRPTAPPTSAPVAPLTAPERGEPVAKIDIPEIGVRQVVVMGVGTGELKAGPGHFPGTPLPGQLGNAAIAGHRTSYGAPFGDLDRLEVGDEIVLDTLAGRFTYRVTGSEIVDPTAVEVVATLDATRATLTLVTCHPKYSTRQRLVVSADLDLDASAAPAPPAPATTVASATTTTVLAGPTTTATPPTTGPPSETSPAEVDEVDPFAAGWFADDAAWWHVAGWGLLLTAIALAATRLGRARGNQRLGAVAGLFPFLIVLYFFFQNVNRLLPPGL